MSKHERRDEMATPPSKAPGESGDREARQEAEEALAPGRGDGEAGDTRSPNTKDRKRASRRQPSGH